MGPRSPIRRRRAGAAWLVLLGAVAAGGAGAGEPEGAPGEAAALMERLRRMEQRLDEVGRQNESMRARLDRVTEQNERLSEENRRLAEEVRGLGASAGGPRGGGEGAGAEGGRPLGPSESGGGSKSTGGDPTTSGRAQVVGNRHVGKLKLKGVYDWDNDGFRFATEDDEFTLGVRVMTQVDARVYQQRDQDPVSGGIYAPRSRIYFEGNLTRPIQYGLAFQQSYASLNLLDVYLQWNYDPRLRVRFGRYKTPFTYEWYRIHVWELLAPERSLFAQNFEGNRRFGLMASGSLFEKRAEYAVGTFDGGRNSYLENANAQDVMAFLNLKPFEPAEGHPLRDFQFGGSVDAGHQNQEPSPGVISTSKPPSPGNLADVSPSVPILAFNADVRERGYRGLWELHAAYYYKGLSLLGAWQGGVESYAVEKPGSRPVRVPIGGYFVQAGYILTGETIRDRTLIDPIRPFDLRPGKFGLGAFEVTSRISELSLGREVFNAGLADPNLWSNRAYMTDLGFNWYMNKFVKLYFDWEHVVFGQPVYFRPGRLQKTSDLFWLRAQVYF